MAFLKGYSDEIPPGPASEWGGCVWYFEVDSDRVPVRQAQLFENGTLLLYDEDYLDDEYGGLGDQPLPHDGPFEDIVRDEFDTVWEPSRAINRS